MDRGRSSLIAVAAWAWSSRLLAPLVAVAPLLWLARREFSYFDERSLACCDWAVMEFHAGRALRLDELLGPYSRYGWNHPGPALFYASAPLYWLSGRRFAGLSATAVVVNIVCVALIVVVARRGGGPRAGWTAAAVMIAFCWLFGLNELANPWNPLMVILPTTLAAVSLAAAVQGIRWTPALAVAAGSFAVQSHVASAPIVAGMGIAAFVLLLTEIKARRWPLTNRHLLTTVGLVVLVMWGLPLYEELRPGEGNVETLVGYFGSSSGGQAAGDVVRNVGAQLTLSVRSMGDYINPLAVFPAFGPARWAVAAVQLVLVGAAVTVGRARGRVFASSLAIVAAAGAAMALASTFRAVDELYTYLTTAAIGVGLALWLSVALFLSDVGDSVLRAATKRTHEAAVARGRTVVRVAGPVGMVLVAVLTVRATPSVPYAQQRDGQGLRRVEEAVRGVLEVGDEVVFVSFEQEDWQSVAVAVASLDGHVDMVVPSDMEFMFGPNPSAESVDLCIHMQRSDTDEAAPGRQKLWYGKPIGTYDVIVEAERGPACDAAYEADRAG